MRQVFVVILAFVSAMATAGDSAGTDEWNVSIVQDGKQFKVDKEVKLLRKPFTFVFTGDRSLAYAVVVSVERSELENLKTPEAIATVIRPTNIEAEEPGRASKELLVHAKGAIPDEDSGCQVLAESPEEGKLSFQEFKVDKTGAATARRDVEKIHFYTNYKQEETLPITAFEGDAFYVLLTGLPPVGHMAHTYPKLIAIKFR
jgi:hypothetical protein